MRRLATLSFASLLAGCGLTHGETTGPLSPPMAGPVAASNTGTFFSDLDVSTDEQRATAADAGAEQVALSSPAWVELGGALSPQDADGQGEVVPVEEEWDILLRPYFWLPKISGTVTVNGLGGRAEITQGQIWRSLDSALLINLYAAKGDTMFRVDAISFAISDDANIQGIPGGSVDGRLEMNLAELDAGVRVIDEKDESLDVYAGLRYVYIKARVSPKGVGIPGQSGSRDWVDPIIGSIYRHEVGTDGWSMLYLADYGGFGVGSASDRTYQLTALAEFNGGGPWSFGLGYRYLMIDHSSGSNPTKDETHLRFSGPVAGASYRF